MLPEQLSSSDRPGERGIALVSVLLLLMMISALASALAVSGRTETLVARNHQTLGQARAAAEAGLNHASQVMIAWLALWPNSYGDLNAALDAVLADPTLLDTDQIDFTATYALGTNLEYEVDLFDDDNPARPGAPANPADIEENGDTDDDANETLVIRTIGRGPNNSAVAVEGLIGPYKLPALVSDGDLLISGSVSIVAQANGGIHANANLTLSGTNVISGVDPDTGLPDTANGTATSSGTYSASLTTVVTNPSESGGGYTPKNVPNVRASFYRSWADFVLESTGQLTCNMAAGCLINGTPYPYGATICNAASNPNNQCRGQGMTPQFGFIYNPGSRSWTLSPITSNPTYADGYTFYVEGSVTTSGNMGNCSLLNPLNITLFTEGSITIGGTPCLSPDNAQLLFVTDGDLRITGNLNMPNLPLPAINSGQILVHEQVSANSSAAILRGQIVIEDAEDVSTLVTRATDGIQGITLIADDDVGKTMFAINGWREVR